MKFIHIADVHLGAVPDSGKPWGAPREKEIWNSFRNIIDKCNEERVELLLIAGDMFHKQPLLRELKEVNYLFGKLETAQVVLMAGNHDYIAARSYYQGFAWNERVHMFLTEELSAFEFPELQTAVYGFSYCNRDITENRYDDVKPGQDNRINILLAHGGDERDIPMNRRKLQEAGFDYIALGHIHKPEVISEKMAYAGSLEPIDKNETGERGYILGEIGRDPQGRNKTAIRFIPSSAREYKRIELNVTQDTTNGSLLDQAREAIRTLGEQHIYSFRIQGLRDELAHFDKEALKSLGNVLEVEDGSVPDYDFEALYRENEGNLIGLFIKKIMETAQQDEIAKKALYYGIEALLGSRG
ncbi:MAG TPA: DNA repair exonuclease [Clostridiales bacterium]|nr:DNA repair exonuclease [Clostridiales bacterium]